jgi:release factor glutamine methyltransferase
MTVHDHVVQGRAQLIEAGLRDPGAAVDAEVLARHALGWDRATYLAERRGSPPAGFAGAYEDLIDRRRRREPVAQILGRREFWGLDFEISREVLVPRPETELLIEEALRIFCRRSPDLVLDVGTGSGCLAVGLATEFPAARVVASDISAPALAVAARNVVRHGLGARIRLVQASLLSGLRGRADLIVSNPPYIPLVSRGGLLPDVREYEPAVALFGGEDGLQAVRALLAQAAGRLAPEGWLLMEFGLGQEESIREAAAAAGLEVARVLEDLQGIARAAVIPAPRS